MKAFIVHPTYETTQNGSRVLLYGRLENGESFLAKFDYKPYFYVKKVHLSVVEEEGLEWEETSFKSFSGEEVLRVFASEPKEVPELRRRLEGKGVECYESDVRFAYRFLIDKGVTAMIEISGEYVEGDGVDRVYENPLIKPTIFTPFLKVLSLDIETSESGEILSAAIATNTGDNVVLIISDEAVKNAKSCESEEELIRELVGLVKEYDPDVITGWNLVSFDLFVLKRRAKKYGVKLLWGRDGSECKVRVSNSFFKPSTATITGRVVLDGIQLLKDSYVSFPDYKLDTVANEVLGDSKLLQFNNKPRELEELYYSDKEGFVEYNLKDATLVLDIIKKTRVLDLAIKRSQFTGLPLNKVSGAIAGLDQLYLREVVKKGVVVPSTRQSIKTKSITGGFVMQPVPGIYDYVLILDFKSLYPSIMRTFNIDPLTFSDDGEIVAPNGARFSKEPGVLPSIIARLMEERELAKEKGDSLTSHAIKIQLNSLFGVLANPLCRFFNLNVANAITSFGRELIKLTAERVKQLGFKVIYGDTDSVFVVSNAKSYDEAVSRGELIERTVNEFLSEFVRKNYGQQSYLVLEFEKCFVKLLMPRVRGGVKGAKKRYVGMLENGELVFVGLEAVRGDWTELAKVFQRELLKKLFTGGDYKSFIIGFVRDLKSNKFNDLLVYRKRLRKPLNEYTKTTPPHVKAARKLGKLETNLVEYVVTVNGPEPIAKIEHSIDYDHYLNKQVKPVADSILVFLGTSFDEVVKGKQKTLLNFK